ncbi:unnamed protein product [Closterium sp. Naga37s-1]|nr:unnamed protein product [Closterium sp. Naga37s-1]
MLDHFEAILQQRKREEKFLVLGTPQYRRDDILKNFLTTFGKYFDKEVGGDDAGEGEELDNLEQHGPVAEYTGAPPVIDAEIVALGALVADGARIDLVNARQSDTDGEPPVPRENAREILRGMRETQQRAPQEETQRCGSETIQQREEGARMEEELVGALQAVHLRVENDEHEEGQGLEMRQGSLNVVGGLEEEVQMAERDNTVVYQRREARTKKMYDQVGEAREEEEANQREEQKRMRLEDEEGKREEDRRVAREKEEARQSEENERLEEQRRVEREKEEMRQRKEDERKREEDRKVERETEEKRQKEERERRRQESEEREAREKEAREKEERERKRLESEEREAREKEAREKEERERRRQESEEREAREKEAREKEERERKRLESEEREAREKEAREKEERERRRQEEKEERERRRLESEGREAREKEAGEKEERERRRLESEGREAREKEAGEKEERERRRLESEGREAREKEAREKERERRRLESEGREAREKEAREKEERERRRQESEEREAREKEAREKEERERKRLESEEREARERDKRQEEERKRRLEDGRRVGREREEARQKQERERKRTESERRRNELQRLEREKQVARQMEEDGEQHGPERQRDRREEHERREMGGAPHRNERQREVAGLGEQGAGGQRRGDGTHHTSQGQRGARVFQTQAGRGAGEGARQVVVGDHPAEAQQGTTVRRAAEVGLEGLGTGGQMEEVGEHHSSERQRDRREEHQRREMGGAPQRNERQREVAGLGEQGAGGQRRGDGTRHTSQGQRGAKVFQTQAGRGAGEGARQVVVGDQPTEAQQGTTREGGRRDDQTARKRVGEEDRRMVEQSRQAGLREGDARRTLQGERMAEEQVWRGVGWGVGAARQRENQARQAGGRVEEALESAASALPMQRRHPCAAVNPAAVQAEELEEGEWVAVETQLQGLENAGPQVFEETEGGFEEAGDRIAAGGGVHTTPELMRRLTVVARNVARISSEQTVRFSDCMAEIRQFGSQMQGWDLRYLQDYDDLTHEYHVLKDSVARERDELVQLRTALSTATADARAAAADAGRAAAAAVVGTLEEKFAGFFDTVAERLRGVVEQAMEAASKGGNLEATMAPESVNHLEKAFEDSVYTTRAGIVGSSERAAENRAADTAAEPSGTREERAAAFEKRRKEDEQAKEAERAERAAQEKRKADEEKRVREEQAKEAERAKRAAAEKRKAEDAKRVQEEQAKEAERAKRAAAEKRKAEDAKRVREEQAKEAERAKRAAAEKREGEDAKRVREEKAKEAERAKRAATEKREGEDAKRAKEAERAKRAAEEKRKAEDEKRVREEQAKEAERAKRAAEEKRKKAEEDKRLREEQAKALKVAEEKRAEALKWQMELQSERERMQAQMEKLRKLEEAAKEEMERQQEELEAQKEKMEKERQQIAATDVEGVAGQGQGGDAILSVVPTAGILHVVPADPRQQPLELVDLAGDVESLDLTVQADSESQPRSKKPRSAQRQCRGGL